MMIAFWCVFIAALLPYVWTACAKVGARGYDNNAPRQFADAQQGMRQRANWAQYNSFEAFPAFAAAVFCAHLMQVEAVWLNGLAVTFVVARTLYGVTYLLDLASLRSVVWFIGFGSMVALFLLAGLRYGGVPM
ncbi:MAG: MAPEG family protein [Xanthomonadales bacterium]|jgi:uncharacterized MAPEG superfamily protein|nr:MAPEG family protein [Xanthomonadales bacterium]